MTASSAAEIADTFDGGRRGGSSLPPIDPGALQQARSRRFGSDALLGTLVRAGACAVLLMMVSLVSVLLYAAGPSMKTFGAKFLVTSTWRPNELETFKRDAQGKLMKDEDGEPIKVIVPPSFGALPVIYGTA